MQSTSPAINKGVAISGLTRDFEGNPIVGSPDIGAYEYQNSSVVTTCSANVNAPVDVFIIGDSTAQNYSSSLYPREGWGMELQQFFNSNSVIIHDNAVGGASSKSYYNSAAWTQTYNNLGPGDYLLIQFGANDDNSDPAFATDPYTTYQQYLQDFINAAYNKGAYPILLTSLVVNYWNSSTNPPVLLDISLGEYPQAMRDLAKEQDVTLIDLYQKTEDYFNSLDKQPLPVKCIWMVMLGISKLKGPIKSPDYSYKELKN